MVFTPNHGNHGHGWHTDTLKPEEGSEVAAVAHNGGIFGFNSRILRILDDRHLVVVLHNAPGASINEISGKIVAILYNEPIEPPEKDRCRDRGEKPYRNPELKPASNSISSSSSTDSTSISSARAASIPLVIIIGHE